MWMQQWACQPSAWYYHLLVVFSWWFSFKVLHSVLFCFFKDYECLSGSWPLCRLSVRYVHWSLRVLAWQNSEVIKRLVRLTFSNHYRTLPLAEKQKANEKALGVTAVARCAVLLRDGFGVVSTSVNFERLWALESHPPWIIHLILHSSFDQIWNSLIRPNLTSLNSFISTRENHG